MAASSEEKARMTKFAENVTEHVAGAGFCGAAFIFHKGSHAMAVRCEPEELYPLMRAAQLSIEDFMRKANLKTMHNDYIDNVQMTVLREASDAS